MAGEFVCNVGPEFRSACTGLGEYEGKGYCVLHYPGEDKSDDFRMALERKLARASYDFTGVVFPDGTTNKFVGAIFCKEANFVRAKFSGNASFGGAKFTEGAAFNVAEFGGFASFTGVEFSANTDFQAAEFSEGGTDFTQAKFGGYTFFSKARFRGGHTSFEKAEFDGELTSFWGAKFNGESTVFVSAEFRNETIDFRSAEFSGNTDFTQAEFSGLTEFTEAEFYGEYTFFDRAEFDGELTSFRSAKFNGNQTSFAHTVLGSKHLHFNGARFNKEVVFLGTEENTVFVSQALVEFDRCVISEPDLFTFSHVLLRPGWFVNANVRKVDFTDVQWYGLQNESKGQLRNEIDALKERAVGSPYTLLAQACRRLAANAEENGEYSLANEFHYWSMDALRIGCWSVIYRALLKEETRQAIAEGTLPDITNFRDLRFEDLDAKTLLKKDTWHEVKSRTRFGLVNALYWVLSGYGERAGRAFWVLVALCGVFATLYALVGPTELQAFSSSNLWQSIGRFVQAIVYSLGAMARLNPEPRPDEPGLFQFLVIVEGILGPLQVALLALAVRRKVMR